MVVSIFIEVPPIGRVNYSVTSYPPIVALTVALWKIPVAAAWLPSAEPHALLIGVIGIVLLITSVTLQYGLAKVSANRAAVILLFELIVSGWVRFLGYLGFSDFPRVRMF